MGDAGEGDGTKNSRKIADNAARIDNGMVEEDEEWSDCEEEEEEEEEEGKEGSGMAIE